MESTTADQVVHSFVADGSSTYTIPQWIFSIDDIKVYWDQSLQLQSTYTISIPSSSGYDITFSVPPLSPTKVTICRHISIINPEDFHPGNMLTAEDLNTKFEVNYLIALDNAYYAQHIKPSYGDVSLTYGEGNANYPEAGDLNLPILSTPNIGDSPRVWGKDHNGTIIDVPLDPGGISAEELETELAAATSSTSSGAYMIGYWDGNQATTVQHALEGTSPGGTKIAYYTNTTQKFVMGNGMVSQAGSTNGAQYVYNNDPATPSDKSVTFGMRSGDGKTIIKDYDVLVDSTNSTTINGTNFTWTNGAPQTPVPATGNTDTLVATKGFVKGTTVSFIEHSTPDAAKAAAAADTNALNFHYSAS